MYIEFLLLNNYRVLIIKRLIHIALETSSLDEVSDRIAPRTTWTVGKCASIFAEKSMDLNESLAKASRAKRSEPSRVYHRREHAYVRTCV